LQSPRSTNQRQAVETTPIPMNTASIRFFSAA